MENLIGATPWQIVNNTVLAIAIAWVIWEVFSLRQKVTQGGGIFPATIPILFIFAGAIVGVELLRVSPLHLIWLFMVSSLLGLIAIVSPFVQQLSMRFLVLLAKTKFAQDDAVETTATESTPDNSATTDNPTTTDKFKALEPDFKSLGAKSKRSKGFGN